MTTSKNTKYEYTEFAYINGHVIKITNARKQYSNKTQVTKFYCPKRIKYMHCQFFHFNISFFCSKLTKYVYFPLAYPYVLS